MQLVLNCTKHIVIGPLFTDDELKVGFFIQGLKTSEIVLQFLLLSCMHQLVLKGLKI